MPNIPAAAVAATGLVGGYAVARWTRKRPLGGAAFAAAGAVAARQWQQQAGTGKALALTGVYLAAFGGSHPLAKRIGAWPAVFSVAGAMAVTATVVTRRGQSA
ncbi:hypothetical protein [Streptomyces sp. NBC_00344]|uniref:hypothetical protein n=1 Tax=Streptomyces sp. NBC_00344 TaxID=2975720 RepID=UPI002E207BCD